jgi:AcrR family transcriptional regulator
MTTQAPRKRHDPRREATRTALIEAAERLFAESGVEAVSTRQIGAAIGSLNTNVVAYHFGNKPALIEAVFHHRLPEIDRRRGELLAAPGPTTIPGLVRAFALPLFEQTDSAGQHSFARFLGGLERSGLSAARAEVAPDYPHSQRLTELLVAQLPPETAGEGTLRIRLIVSLFATVLQVIDRDSALAPAAARRMFDNAIAMAAAAFGAPVQG